MIIKNGQIFHEEGSFSTEDLLINGKLISEVGSSLNEEGQIIIDANDCYVIPGLTDLHFHGCMGYDFCDGTKEAFDAIASYELSNGVTTIAPATMTLSELELTSILTNAASYSLEQESDLNHSKLVGVYLEGPFLSLAKKGAQNPVFLHAPDAEMFQRLQKCSNDMIKVLAIAPEETNAIECIKQLSPSVRCSIAHTTSDYETATKAFEAGACQVTHLYNAMPPLNHRAPGVIGAAFDAKHSMVELICDGHHINPSVVRITFQLFGDDRVILISDSMSATGMPDGMFMLGGQDVTVSNSVATLADGTIAGSTTNLHECMCRAIRMGIPKESAIKAATINPAKALGIDDQYGSITTGKIANLLILNKDFSIRSIIFNGEVIK